MAGKRKAPAKKPVSLVYEGTQWYIVDGKKKLDVGRNRRVAERYLAEYTSGR